MTGAGGGPGLAARLRLIVITDRDVAMPRSVDEVVAEALAAGAPCVQLRDKSATAADLLGQARRLREVCSKHGALFFVNDRADVALTCGADGVHLGPDDVPVAAIRSVAPEGFLIGYSTDDPDAARRAVSEGADYVGCGAVFATSNKADAGDVIGPEGLARVVEAVDVPVVGIGGVTPERVAAVAAAGAAGCAVIGAVMGAPDPADSVRRLMAPFPAGG